MKGLVGLIALMEELVGLLTVNPSCLVVELVWEGLSKLADLVDYFMLSSQTTEKSCSSTGPDIFELSHLLEVKPQVRRWVILVW